MKTNAGILFAVSAVSALVSAYLTVKNQEIVHNERVYHLIEMHTKVYHRLAPYVPVEVLREALNEVEFDGIVEGLKDS